MDCIIILYLYPLLGGIALDPSQFKTPNPVATMQAFAVHNACGEIGKWVGSLQPDLLLLSTPHGVADLTQFSFFLNSKVCVREGRERGGREGGRGRGSRREGEGRREGGREVGGQSPASALLTMADHD